ncbi:hypothetical protein HanXRQr2_Chr15g0713751 [Helianthus annuus]|uniref:Uncharacterized protein n=1 Tax=Helianthus annuus TaxID=4232 RepID=A0A9K3H3W6_HELAN|nr:hypothetical protein HanXRQr2_Chr15g0713751 [Helianthus annuus]KAJ0452712.1 hypothetical protein HanHA300_Chr15g0582071 [Helianthus annuus]KAJ0474622.1 hypothetical protein HanHA89_Chr15g0631821 [Helianthus annuus]KAJ0650179.1 hypothetical protein HanLR1_Chr15g0592741 [Helianthus annuus]KAJ0653953.1 hypothetical protein HanOQP8_Chr15g0589401 [Helianthus annuus]
MLELNLIIRFVAILFLFLSSSCFTSLVQSVCVCNRSSDLVGLYYADQRNNLASNFLHINTNTSTSDVLNYNPNWIPSQIMYKKMHKRGANLTSAVWIQSYTSSYINRVVCSCVNSSISTDYCLLLYSVWQKNTLDSVSLAPVPSPDVDLFIVPALKALRFVHICKVLYCM